MKHLSLLKSFAVACGAMAAALIVSSCGSTPSPVAAYNQLQATQAATVFSYNDAVTPAARICSEAGPLPERTARAMKAWLRASTVKTFSYAYPQYYVSLTDTRGRQAVWGICSDGMGNLVGILIPRSGVAAWDLPFIGNYRMYVCETNERKGLSDAIMESLADAGYDSYRIETRKSQGLTQGRYLISKPLSEKAQIKLAEIKKKEEKAQETAEEPAEESAPTAESETEEVTDKVEEATPAADSEEESLDDLDDELDL
ncbi:MAG: hypothetical protein IJO34_01685 [Akkermansia sp.]|nr:hypothetical protein [Akkermansia sp.]